MNRIAIVVAALAFGGPLAFGPPALADMAHSMLVDNAYAVDDARRWIAMSHQMKVAYAAGVIDVFVRKPGLIFEGTPLGTIGTCLRGLKLTPEEIVQEVDSDYAEVASERDSSPSIVVEGFPTFKLAPCVSHPPKEGQK